MNRWIKFGIASVLWVLIFVVWMRSGWMLLGLVVIFDIYITKFFERNVLPRHRELARKNRLYYSITDWAWAIVYSVVLATVIHTCVFQFYKIPSQSMEKSLMVGDYLYVSKISYGPRMIMTPLAVPLVHNVLPVFGGKSYCEGVQWKYKRLKGLKPIRRDDAVVFNWPADPAHTPVDKRDNYIKRCVGLPGDTLQIVGTQLYVNGVPQPRYEGMQQTYEISTSVPFSEQVVFDDLRIYPGDFEYDPASGKFIFPLTQEGLQRVERMGNVTDVELVEARRTFFPTVNGWTENDYGPIWVPARGATVELNLDNIELYGHIIEVYEHNSLEVRNGVIYINGQVADSYTFSMDYYWMMGDNRNSSSDSRYWGFVPEDHIVGKASFVWLSLDPTRGWFDGKVRWSKMFKKVR